MLMEFTDADKEITLCYIVCPNALLQYKI